MKNDNRCLAELLADKLFEVGDNPGNPCQRIEFKGGNYTAGETNNGGLCKKALIDFFERNLKQQV
jgi:hypothetical protein